MPSLVGQEEMAFDYIAEDEDPRASKIGSICVVSVSCERSHGKDGEAV